MKQLILEDQIAKEKRDNAAVAIHGLSANSLQSPCKEFAETASAKFIAEAVSATNLQRLQPLQRICRGASADSLQRRPLRNGHEAEARAASAPINRKERRRERGGKGGESEEILQKTKN